MAFSVVQVTGTPAPIVLPGKEGERQWVRILSDKTETSDVFLDSDATVSSSQSERLSPGNAYDVENGVLNRRANRPIWAVSAGTTNLRIAIGS